jgi:hypothetical protein
MMAWGHQKSAPMPGAASSLSSAVRACDLRRCAVRLAVHCRASTPLVEAPPAAFDLQQTQHASLRLVAARYPQLASLVKAGPSLQSCISAEQSLYVLAQPCSALAGTLLALPRRPDYVERRSDGYQARHC